MKRILLRYCLPLLLIFWLRSAFFAVDYSEYAYVTRFGEPVVILDGATDAGLHLKSPWPIDSVQRLDRRLQVFDLPAVESLTRDLASKTVDKTLAADAFVTWRIPDSEAADRFLRTVGTPEQARRILGPRVNGRLAATISTMPLEELIAVSDDKGVTARSEKLRNQLLGVGSPDNLKDKVQSEYGIEIVELRLRRFSYPETVRARIAERIRSERERKAADYESEGRKRAADISSAAEKLARNIEADARAKKQLMEAQADVDADRIRNEAQAQDPKFFEFLQKLKAYQTMLSDTRDVLLLSSKHPLFEMMLDPGKIPNANKNP